MRKWIFICCLPDTVWSASCTASAVQDTAACFLLYDIWLLASLFEFHGPSLMQAISRTFQRRITEVPEVTPIALTGEFHSRVEKQRQWQAFLSCNNLDRYSVSLAEAVLLLNRFLMPVCEALYRQLDFTATWVKGSHWE